MSETCSESFAFEDTLPDRLGTERHPLDKIQLDDLQGVEACSYIF